MTPAEWVSTMNWLWLGGRLWWLQGFSWATDSGSYVSGFEDPDGLGGFCFDLIDGFGASGGLSSGTRRSLGLV